MLLYCSSDFLVFLTGFCHFCCECLELVCHRLKEIHNSGGILGGGVGWLPPVRGGGGRKIDVHMGLTKLVGVTVMSKHYGNRLTCCSGVYGRGW